MDRAIVKRCVIALLLTAVAIGGWYAAPVLAQDTPATPAPAPSAYIVVNPKPVSHSILSL
ncbi:MAG: hypothetical protein IPK16_14930 [Anaerolineales bacterium]|nr:hypothetical protein [Anaerolineales bacterium]